MAELPLLDVASLWSRDETALARLAARLGAACRGSGFFGVTGHGIPEAVLGAAFRQARVFFAQPASFKAAYAIETLGENRGYVGLGVERLGERPADQKEAFNIPFDPARAVWADLPGWQADLSIYLQAMHRLGVALHRALARDLGAAEDFFDDKLDHPMATLRLLHYPRAGVAAAEPVGAGEHTDYGNLTLLATDGVAGLELRRRDGTWTDVSVPPDALLCNIGDCLMRWTNDVYVSTPHRVRRPESDRYSIAYFLDANAEALVAPLPSCIAATGAAKYPPVTAAQHVQSRLDATYPHRKAARRAG